MTNQTDYNVDIAYVFLTDQTQYFEELTAKQIEKSKDDYLSLDLIEENDGGDNFKELIKFDQLQQFDTVCVGEEYRIPLSWFLMDVSIFYRSIIDNEVTYNKIIPNIK